MYHSNTENHICYLKLFSFSVSIKITKHWSYIVHIGIQELILTVFMSSVLQTNIYIYILDWWSCAAYQKNSPTRGYTLHKKMWYDRSMIEKHPVFLLWFSFCVWQLWGILILWTNLATSPTEHLTLLRKVFIKTFCMHWADRKVY